MLGVGGLCRARSWLDRMGCVERPASVDEMIPPLTGWYLAPLWIARLRQKQAHAEYTRESCRPGKRGGLASPLSAASVVRRYT